jgi:quercetin dioxygenase-like cupin family protein
MRKTDQKFSVSHLDEADFRRNGLRPYAEYRDLGIAAATNGMVQAHVIRLVDGAKGDTEPSKKHYHGVQFQMIYCLKGWIKSEFEGNGVHVMRPGTCWLQPAGIVHKVIDQSADLELLEINMPAVFETVDVE